MGRLVPFDEAARQRRAAVRLQRAIAIVQEGGHLLALAEAEELSAEKALPGDTLYDLGCVFALAAPRLARDEARPLRERERRAELASRKAVALLQRAAQAGFFREPRNRAHLDKDTDLDSLRSRDDYRAFIKTLPPAPAKP